MRHVVIASGMLIAACRAPPAPAPAPAPAPVAIPEPPPVAMVERIEPVLPPTPPAPTRPFGGGTVKLAGGRTWTLAPTAMPSPDELAIEAKLASGDESPETLRAAFAYVSGAETPDARANAERVFDEKLALVKPAVAAAGGVRAKGAALLKALHAKVLKTYVEQQTYPLAALQTGAFNCVSSAIVYDAFAAALGIPTSGATAPSHAFSYVKDGESRIEVQTTSAAGFDPKMSKAEYRSFLAQRHLEAALNEPPKEVTNAQLFALALENRLGMHHDAVAADSEAYVRAQLATELRMAALVPGKEQYRRNVVASWQQLASFLDEAHRGAEAFHANAEAHRAAAFVHDEAMVAASRTNVVAYAQHWLQDSLPEGPATLTLAVRAEARKLLGCPGDAACDDLERVVRSAVFEAAKKRDDAGRVGEAWKLVAPLVGQVPLAGEAVNLAYFAQHEGERRWKADPAGTEAWAAGLLAKLPCAAEAAKACGQLAGWVSGQYFDSDEPRAQAWAKKAFAFDPDGGSNRANYVAATHNAINRAVDGHDCARAKALLAELEAAGLQDPPSKPVVADCD